MAASIARVSMGEINITPLVDVMLVLLVIFMVTVPTMDFTNAVSLPQGSDQAQEARPESVRLRVSAAGIVEWNGEAITPADLDRRFAELAQASRGSDGRIDPLRQPMLRIHADAESEYQSLAQLLAQASNAGLVRIDLGIANR